MTIEDEILQTPEGWWVLKNDTHLSRWVEQTHRLDHDQYVLQKLAPYIKPGSVAMDLGAAIGDHTIFYLNAVGPEGRVIAFEPHPLEFECLRRNCPSALCIPHAVGETEGSVYLFHQPDCVGGSRLIDPELQWPMSRVRRMVIDKNCVFTRQIGFMKIDIEGSETAALRGARRMILRDRPIIWIEINPTALERQGSSSAELRDVLENQLQYKVAEFYPPEGGWNGVGETQCDALLVPI